MSNQWLDYRLRLKRDNREYHSGSWYNHSWNELFVIDEGLNQNRRGERIVVESVTDTQISLTFFDEKTPRQGVAAVLSLDEPKAYLRSEHRQGGNNEFVWEVNDYVSITLEKKE